jgi:hypothetical protein
VFNPGEVIPEYTADVGVKRGEKVDYAICIDGNVQMLVECKSAGSDLKVENASQLFRYFSVEDAKIAVLTNGVVYQFYSDIEAPNRMDNRPFFTCRLDDLKKSDFETLARFSKDGFDIDEIKSVAGTLKLHTMVRRQLEEEFSSPSAEFVRLIGGKVHDGRLTAQVADKLQAAIKSGVAAVIRERVNQRLTAALKDPTGWDAEEMIEPEKEIETTDDEWQGYHIVCAIVAAKVNPERVVIRDAQSYCAILLDDNNRRTIARLHFNSDTTRYLGLFHGKEEARVPVEGPRDIYKHADAILSRVDELGA